MKAVISILKKIGFWLYPIAHLALATIDWFLLGWAIRLYRNSKKLADRKIESLATIVLPILLATLCFDNFVIGAGWAIGEGDILEKLSMLRFLLHYIVVPFFIVVGVEIAHEAGARWANKPVRVLSWIVSGGLAIADISINYVGLELEPTHFLGVLRYTAVNLSGPPIVTIAVNVFMLAIAIGVWIRLRWSILFVGSFIAFAGNAFHGWGPLPGCAAETVMALSLLLTEKFIQSREEKAAEPDTDPFEAFAWEHEKQPYQFIHADGQYEVQPLAEDQAEKANFYLYQAGSHGDGDFIQAYVPTSPQKNSDGKLKVISYLHGFALGLPRFYQIHLARLAAEEGCYVFFPDFQVSTYPDTLEAEPPEEEISPLKSLFKLLSEAGTKQEEVDEGNIFKTIKKARAGRKKAKIARKLLRPSNLKYVRVSLSLLLVVLAIRLTVSLINKQLGENFIKLVTTVALSLAYKPTHWGDQAFDLTAIACNRLSQQHQDLDAEFDFYVFGHSLGGLFALSWPYFYKQNLKVAEEQGKPYVDYLKRFKPKQILTADPAPSTEMGVPSFIVPLLKPFNIPFLESPVDIANTGKYLEGIPVGILHGVNDKIVPPKKWVDKPLLSNKTNYEQIQSNVKEIYFSESNPQKDLEARHNQAVTDTSYFANALFKNFGGAKSQPDAYNFDFMWPGLERVTQEQTPANQLLEFFNTTDFKIVPKNPPQTPVFQRLSAVLIGLGGLAALYWLFSHHLIF